MGTRKIKWAMLSSHRCSIIFHLEPANGGRASIFRYSDVVENKGFNHLGNEEDVTNYTKPFRCLLAMLWVTFRGINVTLNPLSLPVQQEQGIPEEDTDINGSDGASRNTRMPLVPEEQHGWSGVTGTQRGVIVCSTLSFDIPHC